MNVSTSIWIIAVAVALSASGCNNTPEAEGKEAGAEVAADKAKAAAEAEKPASDSARADEAAKGPEANEAAAPADGAAAKGGDEAPGSDAPVPLGVNGAIFMIDGGKGKLLDATGKELSAFDTSAKAGMTFYDPTKARVFAHKDGVIYAIDLNSKKTETFATLPKTDLCKVSKLDVISSWGLGLTAGGKALCVRTQDGPESKMKVAIGHQIDVGSKKITSKVTADYERQCSERADEEFCTPDFDLSYPHKEPNTDLQGMEVDRYGCKLKNDGKTITIKRPKNAKGWCDLTLEGFTPSRRFIGVTTLLNEDDATRVFDLVDLKTGKVLSKFRTTTSPDTRIDWSLKSDALLVEDKLVQLSDSPKSTRLNASAIFIGKN